LSDLEIDNPSAPNIGYVEDVRRSISLMVPTGIDPNDSLRLHFLAIFSRDLPGEGNDSRDNQYLSLVHCRWREGDEPDVQ
jgi:hypothetical protein